MEKSAMIIINPTSGKEKASEYEDKIKDVIKMEYPNLIIKYTKGQGDATKFAKNAGEDSFDLVVSLGGDGTINETVNGIAGFKNPPMLGIIPMGTVNDLARALNIPLQPEEAIELLGNGTQRKIDVGIANELYFTNILGVGNIARAIHDVDSEEKTKLGPLAYFISTAKELIEGDIFSVKLEMDQESWEGDVSVVIAGLIDSLGGFKTILSNAEVGDGMFHIFAIKKLDIPELMKITPSVFSGKITDSDNVKYFRSKSLKIKALNDHKHESDVDGEKGPELPLRLKILPGHLIVISGMED